VDATSHSGKSRSSRRFGLHGTKGRAGERASPGPAAKAGGDEATPFYGALDLGTNNCRLLIASASFSGFQVKDAFSRIVRLGEGLSLTGALSQSAMDRTIEALRVCSNKLVWHKVKRHRLIATEACRMASNGAAFIARVEAETGLELEIIDRETEARLAAAGAEPLIDEAADSAVVFDIGGGSTEIMWVERGEQGREIKAWTSLAAGVVTISERFGGGVDVTHESFSAMRAHVRPLVAAFVEQVTLVTGAPPAPAHLLGTSGTVTTIAGVQLGLRRYDRSRVDGCWLRSADVGQVTEDLLRMSYHERTQNPCIGRERADLVMAGCAILEEIRLAFPANRIRVADRGLREGILTQLIKADQHPGRAA
jgi:exopolyphosphatase/guanosine-5'-triphosphate,3'-diphosphate pyrophosphatase